MRLGAQFAKEISNMVSMDLPVAVQTQSRLRERLRCLNPVSH